MTKALGFLFPGQGAQYVGMGADLYSKYSQCRDTYDRAVEILEIDIRKVSFEGPEEELRQTQFTQPAVLVHSLAVLSVLTEVKPAVVCGHSLGEYSALYAASALGFNAVLRLVRKRSELMAAEGSRNPGTMAAIIGVDSSWVEGLCGEVEGVVVPANYNEPKQTVISGEVAAVKQAVALAQERGAKAVMLPVSGAFHSPLLTQSAAEFSAYLEEFVIGQPACPVVSNATGRPSTDPEEIRSALSRQLTSPVRWAETMASVANLGCTELLEIGPGRVLSGLARRTDRSLNVTAVGKVEEIETLTATFQPEAR